jgi:hypothetical protein
MPCRSVKVGVGGGDQGEHGSDPGAGGQVGDLVVIAGVQADELGIGPVDQGATLDDQVLAVVEQGSQVDGRADSEPDRRQLLFTCGDPGDGQCVNRVGLPLPSWPRGSSEVISVGASTTATDRGGCQHTRR